MKNQIRKKKRETLVGSSESKVRKWQLTNISADEGGSADSQTKENLHWVNRCGQFFSSSFFLLQLATKPRNNRVHHENVLKPPPKLTTQLKRGADHCNRHLRGNFENDTQNPKTAGWNYKRREMLINRQMRGPSNAAAQVSDCGLHLLVGPLALHAAPFIVRRFWFFMVFRRVTLALKIIDTQSLGLLQRTDWKEREKLLSTVKSLGNRSNESHFASGGLHSAVWGRLCPAGGQRSFSAWIECNLLPSSGSGPDWPETENHPTIFSENWSENIVILFLLAATAQNPAGRWSCPWCDPAVSAPARCGVPSCPPVMRRPGEKLTNNPTEFQTR